MTEAEWLACSDQRAMLDLISGGVSDRKLRLLAVACCWDNLHPLWEGPASPAAVATASRFADGLALTEQLQAAQAAVYRQVESNMYGGEPVWDPTYYTCAGDIREGIYGCMFYSGNRGAAIPGGPNRDEEVARLSAAEAASQTKLLRCIVGNPFRPVAFTPGWRTSTVMGLAASIYESRSFHDLPVLADALEEANCTDESLLRHLRGGGVHARGCFALDHCLGKA